MRPDQDRLKVLLVDTIALLCKSGLTFRKELRVQGLLGITVDDEEVFIVQLDEKLFADGHRPGRSLEGADSGSKCQTTSPPYPVILTRNKPSFSPTRGFRTRGRPSLTHRPMLAKRQRLDHSQIFSETNMEISSLRSDLNLNIANVCSPSELGTIASINKPVNDIGVIKNSLTTRPVLSDCFQPEYTSLPFDNSFLQPDFAPARFSGSTDDLVSPVPASGIKLNIKRKIKNTGNMSMPGVDNSPKSQHERSRYELSSQWSIDSDQQSGKGDWHEVESTDTNSANCIKHETSDEQFKESVNESWDSANGAQADNSCNNFSTKYQRRRHRESEDKCFACQYDGCDKAFFRKDHLVRHQRQKHGKPFGVDSQMIFYCHESDCNKMFYKVSTLRRHMVEAHNYAPEPEFAEPSISCIQHQTDLDPEFSQSSLNASSEFGSEFTQPPTSSSQPGVDFESNFSKPLVKPSRAEFSPEFSLSSLQAQVECEPGRTVRFS